MTNQARRWHDGLHIEKQVGAHEKRAMIRSILRRNIVGRHHHFIPELILEQSAVIAQ
jgi:hypothetical protein